MPIYEYRCTNGHTFESIQSFSDEPLTKCEVCAAPVERVLHAPAVQFKGSGFYNTDYGTRNRQREKAAAAESKKSAESSEAKSAKSGAPSTDKPKTEKTAPPTG
ncbi:MAG: FmdB family zinc ribbon protein [Solirubrobacteraceae bacterium]|jgi:putative FmdB family regulatory protein